jgi:putative FmdB family regulatory protein
VPTYQYACTECGHQFETVQSFSEDALTDCPQCSGRLRKVFNAVGIVFKGSGFYRTDSRKSASNGSSSSSSETKSKSETKTDSAGSDSKPKAGSSTTSGSTGSSPSTAGSAA